MKKLLFTFCLLLTAVNGWGYNFYNNGIYYNITSSTTVEVTHKGDINTYSGGCIIPETVEYKNKIYNVTSIGTSAFYMCSDLTSITIPSSVTSIGKDVFQYCSNLNKAKFASIEKLCNIKFEGISSNPLCFAKHLYVNGEELKDIVIPNSVTSIGDFAFAGFEGLSSVTIPQSVTTIGKSAFVGCKGLTSVTIPYNVTSIGNYAFSNCFLAIGYL